MSYKTIAKNRKAFHEYSIEESLEAGIVLAGTEVKSIRSGKVNLGEGWINVDDLGEVFLMQVHISPYAQGNIYNHQAERPRKLLLHKRQIDKLSESLQAKGMTAVPLKVYLKGSLVKIEIGIGKGKKNYDKRQSAKKKEAQKDMERAMKAKD